RVIWHPDIDTVVVDSLKALDPKRPIREADMCLIRLATNDSLPEKQAPPPQSALASSRRGGRSRSTHPASLAGYSGDQVINSGEKHSQNRGCVRFVISDH